MELSLVEAALTEYGYKFITSVEGQWQYEKGQAGRQSLVVVENGFLKPKRIENNDMLGIYVWGVKFDKNKNILYINTRYCDMDMFHKSMKVFNKRV